MTIQMNEIQANEYAMRMFNDDYWDKKYIPDLNALKLLRDNLYGDHIEVPVELKLERHCVGDDDAGNYLDRPKALESVLADDDSGEISITCTLAIRYPINLALLSNCDDENISLLHIESKDFYNARMHDGNVMLSEDATNHLFNCLGEHYVILDTIDQNKGLIKSIGSKSSTLTLEHVASDES